MPGRYPENVGKARLAESSSRIQGFGDGWDGWMDGWISSILLYCAVLCCMGAKVSRFRAFKVLMSVLRVIPVHTAHTYPTSCSALRHTTYQLKSHLDPKDLKRRRTVSTGRCSR